MIDARIHSITYAAEGVLLFDLRTLDGADMAPLEPGAHIDMYMPRGLCRSYSLLNDPSERHRYVVGIQKEAKSRGGSRWMHESARVGNVLPISRPKNDFRLDEHASHSVFIAGGIGITPLWCMIQRLERLGRSWTLYYGARSRNAAALLDFIEAPQWADRVNLHFDDQSDGRHPDIRRIVTCAP